MPLFELGSLHHDYYLVNLRIPSAFDYEGHSVNVDSKIGRLVDLWLVGIHQVFWSLSQFSTDCFVTTTTVLDLAKRHLVLSSQGCFGAHLSCALGRP